MSHRFTHTLLALAVTFASCAKKDDVILRTADGKELTAEAIDADPLALLPGNPVGAATLDARQLFASQLGQRLLAIVQARSPLPAESDFVPSRDLERVYLGFYSMQGGADVAGVAVGRFDPSRIEKAAQSSPRNAVGAPVVASQYAGRTLYTSGGLGFATLTQRTLLFGNETGIRRALDRIEEGRIRRRLPKWMEAQLASPTAPLVAGADLSAQPVTGALREQLTFLDGLRTMSLLGNFQDPGLNLAGTLAYDTPDAAARGAANLKQLHASLSSAGFFMAIAGIPQPLRTLDARAKDTETRFVIGIDASAVALLQAYLVNLAPAGGR